MSLSNQFEEVVNAYISSGKYPHKCYLHSNTLKALVKEYPPVPQLPVPVATTVVHYQTQIGSIEFVEDDTVLEGWFELRE